MTESILNDLMAVKGLALCWLGNDSWLIRWEGGLIGNDLDLDEDRRSAKSPIPTEAIAEVLSVQFISHEHDDHFSAKTSGILAKKSNCTFVVPRTCIDKAHAIGIPDERIVVSRPRTDFSVCGICVETQRALHGEADFTVGSHANLDDCGYMLNLAGRRLFQPGDTVLLEEHLSLTAVDVLFVSPTVHNMYYDRSTIFIKAVRPRLVFAQHFGTYIQNERNEFWTRGYPDELRAQLPPDLQQRYHIPTQGKIYPVET
jgi:L-ascorbate metabolism protein UlaG (beta-lactamase superfamily)